MRACVRVCVRACVLQGIVGLCGVFESLLHAQQPDLFHHLTTIEAPPSVTHSHLPHSLSLVLLSSPCVVFFSVFFFFSFSFLFSVFFFFSPSPSSSHPPPPPPPSSPSPSSSVSAVDCVWCSPGWPRPLPVSWIAGSCSSSGTESLGLTHWTSLQVSISPDTIYPPPPVAVPNYLLL